MRRFAFSLPALLVMVAIVAFVPPKPRSSTTVSVRADASAIWVIYSVSFTASPDSVQTTISASGQSSQMKSFLGSARKDSVAFLHGAEGATVGGTVSPKAWKRGAPYVGKALPWSYTEPVVPPSGGVDSLRVNPTSTSLTPGAKVGLVMLVFRS